MLRLLRPALLGLLLGGCAVVSMPAQAQPQNLRSVQWRDVTVQLPRADWVQITPDPDPKLVRHRLLLDRQEALHYGRIIVTPIEAPLSLTPSEVATQFYESAKKSLPQQDGAFSEWKRDTRTIGGGEHAVVSVRYTPAVGTPLVDSVGVLLFPADYEQRQRYLVVQWLDQHSATTGSAPLDELDSFVSSLVLKPLGTVQAADDFSDTDLVEGNAMIGGGSSSGVADVRFANLIVTQR